MKRAFRFLKNNPVIQALLAIVLVLVVSFFMNRGTSDRIVTRSDDAKPSSAAYPYADDEPSPALSAKLPSATIGMRKIQNRFGVDLQTDAKNLYLYGTKIEGADPNSVDLLTEDILVDKANVFVIEGTSASKIEGLIPDGLRIVTEGDSIVLANGTQTYGNIYPGYFKGHFIDSVANPSKLKRVDPSREDANVLTDGKGLYLVTYRHFIRLPISSPVVLKHSLYVIGDDAAYYGSDLIRGADARTLKLSSEYRVEDDMRPGAFYAQDAERVYYEGKAIAGADPKSFKTYPSRYYDEYARDSARVYYRGEPIPGADPSSFKVLKTQPYEGCSEGPYGKDANAVYFKTGKVIGADPSSFQALYNGYGKDAWHSFYGDILMPDAPNELDVACYYG